MLIDMKFSIKEISNRLGHESPETTWKVYAHLFPQIGHRTHFIVSIFFSILTSKYYPTKFIKFIATVFKFLLLDYLTAEKECFHIGLLFTCHFFVFLILYPPVQQIA